MSLDLDLETGAGAAAQARHALDRLSGELTEPQLRDVRLLTSELVTNAVRHAGLSPGDRIRVLVRLSPHALRVEVRDPGHGFERRPPPPDPERASGWGLFLVEEVADRWGMDGDGADGTGTRIWFELDRDGRLAAS
jgi:anti-sigma regulatory factor (Ser/Thr protein kinase)